MSCHHISNRISSTQKNNAMKKLLKILMAVMTCTGLSAQGTCSVSMSKLQQQSNSAVYWFSSNPTTNINGNKIFSWDFGDGTTANFSSLYHNYASTGTYTVTLKMEVFDSVNNTLLCTAYAYDTITLNSISTVSANCSFSNVASGSMAVNFQGSGIATSTAQYYSTYLWNFGDGNTSTLQNPTHTYSNTGSYNVQFTHELREQGTNDFLVKRQCVGGPVIPGLSDSCESNFTANVLGNSMTVLFRSNGVAKSYDGTLIVKKYIWDFGDGDTSSFSNDNHTYAQAGTYQVSLYMEAFDPMTLAIFCRDTAHATVVVSNPPPPPPSACNPSFTSIAQSNNVSNYVFVNTTTYNNLKRDVFTLDFGDGSATQTGYSNKYHSYQIPGTYVVSLKMEQFDKSTNVLNCTAYTFDTIIISVAGNATASCSATQMASGSLTVNFQGLGAASSSSPHYSTYSWNFGDGSTSTLQNPSHTYITAGYYYTTFIHEVRDSSNSSVVASAVCSRGINAGAADTCEVNLNYYVYPNSLNAAFHPWARSKSYTGVWMDQSFSWDFGDGNSSTSASIIHTYAQSGTYAVSLMMTAFYPGTQTVFCQDTAYDTVTVSYIPPPPCSASFTSSQHSFVSNRYTFTNTTTYNQSMSTDFIWDFGDGNSSTQITPTHDYTQAGTYQVSLYMTARDSATQNIICQDTTYDTLIVIVPPAPPACTASYYVDTAASGASNMVVYNNSTPAYNNPNYFITHKWQFGDGDSSMLAFPSHTYVNPGVYVVCLEIWVIDSSTNLGCYDWFCDTLGVDSLGNLIYKNSATGFTLNVLDPATIGQEEYKLSGIEVFPNPANDIIYIDGLSANAKWKLSSLSGSEIGGGELLSSTKSISLPEITNGLYILHLESDGKTKSIKVQINK